MTARRWFALLLPLACAGFALAAPVPKDKDEKPGPVTDEQLKESSQRMKQFGLALHNHHDTYGFLPQNTTTKDGKPGLSWRVAILPFIEQGDLYKKFALDEAWDSDTNKKLIEQMPGIFAPIRVKAKEKGLTFYQGFDGPDTMFEAGKRNTLVGIPDGTSNTIGIVEAGEPVVWTKPEDIKFDAKKALPKLGGLFDGDFHVLCMDGAVYMARGKKLDADSFKVMVTKSDGMVFVRETALGQDK